MSYENRPVWSNLVLLQFWLHLVEKEVDIVNTGEHDPIFLSASNQGPQEGLIIWS